MTGFKKKFLNDNLSTLIVQLLVNFKGFFLLPVLVKSLGTTLYGTYVLVITFFGFLFGISSLGVGFYCRRYLAGEPDVQARARLFYPQLLFHLLCMAVLAIVTIYAWPLVAEAFKGRALAVWLIPVYLLATVFYSQMTDYFRYTGRLTFFNGGIIAVPYATLGLILFLFSLHHELSLNLLFGIEAAVTLAVAIVLFMRMYREIGFHVYFSSIRQYWEDMKLGFPMVINYLLDFILSGSDRYIIAGMISVTAVGHYNPAYTLGAMLSFIPKVFCVVLPAFLFKAVDEGREDRAQSILDYTLKVFLLVAIPFIVGSGVLSRPVLTLLANREVAEQGAWVTPLVGLGILFYGMTLIISNVFLVRLKTKVLLKANILAAFLNIALNIIFMSLVKSILVAAATTMISYLIVFLYAYRICTDQWHIQWDWPLVSKLVGASLAMAMAMKLFQPYLMGSNLLIYVFCELLLGTSVYLSMLVLMRIIPQHMAVLNGLKLWGQRELTGKGL